VAGAHNCAPMTKVRQKAAGGSAERLHLARNRYAELGSLGLTTVRRPRGLDDSR